jgi:hypothetical protein
VDPSEKYPLDITQYPEIWSTVNEALAQHLENLQPAPNQLSRGTNPAYVISFFF